MVYLMELITSKEVCEELGIKANHLHQLQFRKKLCWAEKKGKIALYRVEDVKAYKSEK